MSYPVTKQAYDPPAARSLKSCSQKAEIAKLGQKHKKYFCTVVALSDCRKSKPEGLTSSLGQYICPKTMLTAHFISVMKCNSYVKTNQKYQRYMSMYCAVQTLSTRMSGKITESRQS